MPYIPKEQKNKLLPFGRKHGGEVFEHPCDLLRNYDHNAFYVNVCDGLRFRVYKVEAFFSAVGEAWVVLFHVSYRDLQKLREFKYKHDSKSFCISDIPEAEVKRILFQLKTYGKCDVSFFFSGLEM